MEDFSQTTSDIRKYLDKLSADLTSPQGDLAIVLAAGHGKRIKSARSKMLHEIWGKPTVVRVTDAACKGLGSNNLVVVVGIKAREVSDAVGKRAGQTFAFQESQNGTGHAVSVALEAIADQTIAGDIYIFAGDMGLMTAEAVSEFKQAFIDSKCDMIVLTGIYEGPAGENSYGRIVRVPATDASGREAGDDCGKVIEIIEHKDILALENEVPYAVDYRERSYSFSKESLLNLREFNSGVFAFKSMQLKKYISEIKPDNAQGELYVTDLISIFNGDGLAVGAVPTSDNRTVLGFNTKSVLRQMNELARAEAYERIKDLVTIEDKNDFFVATEVIEQIIALDEAKAPLDILIGKGAYIGKGVVLNKGVTVGSDVLLQGSVSFGENCILGDGVKVTGTADRPTTLGNKVVIRGRSTIANCDIAENILIEFCVLENKRVAGVKGQNGEYQIVRYVYPDPQGRDLVQAL